MYFVIEFEFLEHYFYLKYTNLKPGTNVNTTHKIYNFMCSNC